METNSQRDSELDPSIFGNLCQLDELFSDNVSSILTIKNAIMTRRYYEFLHLYTNQWSNKDIVMLSVMAIAYNYTAVFQSSSHGLALVAVLSMIFFLFYFSINISKLRIGNQISPWNPVIHNAFAVFAMAKTCAFLFLRVKAGQCQSFAFQDTLACNPNASTYSLPQDTAYLILVGSLWLPLMFRGIYWEVRLFVWLMSTLSILGCIIYGGLYNSLPLLVVSIPVSLFFISTNRRENLTTFFLIERLKESANQVEVLTKTSCTLESSHMMANMAHDLKTVCSWLYELKGLPFNFIYLISTPYM